MLVIMGTYISIFLKNSMELQYIEIIIKIIGIAYGIFENNKRQKIQKVIKTIVRAYPGDAAKIEQSCVWAYSNVRDAHTLTINIPDCPEKQDILMHLNRATGATTCSGRMCHVLFNQLLAFQQAQFDTRTIIHPEKEKLDLSKMELESQTA